MRQALTCYGCDVEKVQHIAHDKAVWAIFQGSHVRGCDAAKEVMKVSLYKDHTSLKFGREHWRDDLQSWTFPTQGPWEFRWAPDGRSVFIFQNEFSEYAMCCIPIPPGQEANYDNAVEVSKEWIRGHMHFGTEKWAEVYDRLMKGVEEFVSAQEHGRRATARRTKAPAKPDMGSLRHGVDVVTGMLDCTDAQAQELLQAHWPAVHIDDAVQKIVMAFATGTLVMPGQEPEPVAEAPASSNLGDFYDVL